MIEYIHNISRSLVQKKISTIQPKIQLFFFLKTLHYSLYKLFNISNEQQSLLSARLVEI